MAVQTYSGNVNFNSEAVTVGGRTMVQCKQCLLQHQLRVGVVGLLVNLPSL